jgi:acyl-CoA synthetase (AMP-forming)/AMP-acid ligase II
MGVHWSYEEFFSRSLSLACGLRSDGYKSGDALISDLPNIPENLLLQIACAHLGVAYCTAKDGPSIQKMIDSGVKVRGAVAAQPGFLSESSTYGLTPDSVVDATSTTFSDMQASNEMDFDPPRDPDTPFAFYGSPLALTHGEIFKLGSVAKSQLALTENDRLCVSITLCHSFGIGTGVGGAFLAGSSVLLPAVGYVYIVVETIK